MTTSGSKPSGSATQTTVGVQGTNVTTVASSVPGAATFASLLSSTGVGATISSGGRYTVFVPTDAAMEAVNVAGMSSTERKRFVQYHVIANRAVDIHAVSAGSVMTLSGDPVNFTTVSGGEVKINSSKVVKMYTASNGVVYVVDAPLFPPKKAY